MATRYYGFGKDDNGSEVFQIKILDDTDTQIGTVMSYNPSFSDNELGKLNVEENINVDNNLYVNGTAYINKISVNEDFYPKS